MGKAKKTVTRTSKCHAVIFFAISLLLLLLMAGCANGQEDEKLQEEEQQSENQQSASGDEKTVSTSCVVSPDTFAIMQAVYPDMPKYPQEEDFIDPDSGEMDVDVYMQQYDAWQDYRRQQDKAAEDADALLPFVKTSAQTFFTDTGSENMIYSPLNLYLALGMLSEVTGSDSRAQILDVLQNSSIDDVRKLAKTLWESNYRDDGIVTCTMANSIWLNEQVSYKKEMFQTLAENYYASAFSGEMGSAELNQAFAAWLDEQTGGLLSKETSQFQFDSQIVMALASTIYFRAAWQEEIDESRTAKETFHAPDGDVTCDMMKDSYIGTIYAGEHFTAAQKHLREGGNMIFILPDENASVDDVLMGDSFYEFLSADRDEWKEQQTGLIELSLPKFDVSSQIDLMDGLKTLGICDVFDPAVSDFTPMMEDADGLFVSTATHAARVKVDEEGCEAAAFTVITVKESAALEADLDEIYFTLDRSFLFVVESEGGQPLFIGVVREV